MWISQGALARVDRVQIGGMQFAMKRFLPSSRLAWAREVASHLACQQAEVAALNAYGVDIRDCGWLSTTWIDARTARYHIAHGYRDLKEIANAWIVDFQRRLAAHGYRWIDAELRNLLVLGMGHTSAPPEFKIVDYTITSLSDKCEVEAHAMQLMVMRHGESVNRSIIVVAALEPKTNLNKKASIST